VAHDCPRDGTPAFGCSACDGHLKSKAMHGGALTDTEREFVGATVHVHDTGGGWHQPSTAMFETRSMSERGCHEGGGSSLASGA
jgi:hypothetical protein